MGASERIFELFDRVPTINTTGGKKVDDLNAMMALNDVNFSYPSRPETQVLKGMTLEVPVGSVVALVGPSGGGKSTVVSMIERLYDPISGSVSIGGEDVKTLDPVWLRTKIALVSQEPTLFADTIEENIRYGKASATDEEVVAAATQANAHKFISEFEDGYKTMVGERGVRLSGGQKQRVAIARALLIDPEILLLDEATSALDAESEFLVQQAIDRAMLGRTVLVIAHRLSTVRTASKVVVVQDGAVVEAGTHAELIENDGVYKKLVARQLLGSEATEAEFGAIADTKHTP